MKKFISIIALFAIMCASLSANVILSESEESSPTESTQFSIADKIRSFMLPNNPIALENVTKAHTDRVQEAYDYNIWWDTGLGKKFTEEELVKRHAKYFNSFGIIPENSFSCYRLHTVRYSKQYADTYNFDELISDDKIWLANCNEIDSQKNYYEKDYSLVPRNLSSYGINNDTITFLNNSEAIEQMINNEIDEQILNCKIIFRGEILILYLKGETTDYGIKLYSFMRPDKMETYLENFKVYTMAELIQSTADYNGGTYKQRLLDQKPTYTAEATALQADGLLNGNERGLDLLKPLTRIEATTILVRALGLENEQTSPVSQFTDIPSENWGAKYANIAADHGITKGIGENQFAPNEIVTENQFATLILRSVETTEFDWQTAINILIEREIITADQASTMDLFTRGDMAKIIYEAKQKGLIQ